MSKESSSQLLQKYFQEAAKQGDLQLQSEMISDALVNSMRELRLLQRQISEAKEAEAKHPAPVAVPLPADAPAASAANE